MIKTLSFSTEKNIELVNITSHVKSLVDEGEVDEGVVVVFTPHATAGLIINEDETGLKNDFVKLFTSVEKIKDQLNGFEHNKIDSNAESHLISGLIGSNEIILIKNSQLQLGRWQELFLVELDGPRSRRRVTVKVIES